MITTSETFGMLDLNPDNYTHKGQRVLTCLDQLEVANLHDDHARIGYWAGNLVKAAGDLAAEYLTEEALRHRSKRFLEREPHGN